ncbi:hypothetical protein KIN20_004217 [Parelaphostrongylus tenuis]|uniref:Uncharacterized protein n=1 Tax=Parelaphostrongylus tenuis TaxID=148309 RepID=A0AAD5QEZ2_PARTN|nr:hypothetical protein KIN20_004217 [Parelaphostrongylus tenuis]
MPTHKSLSSTVGNGSWQEFSGSPILLSIVSPGTKTASKYGTEFYGSTVSNLFQSRGLRKRKVEIEIGISALILSDVVK